MEKRPVHISLEIISMDKIKEMLSHLEKKRLPLTPGPLIDVMVEHCHFKWEDEGDPWLSEEFFSLGNDREKTKTKYQTKITMEKSPFHISLEIISIEKIKQMISHLEKKRLPLSPGQLIDVMVEHCHFKWEDEGDPWLSELFSLGNDREKTKTKYQTKIFGTTKKEP